jgi:hypothetical protein
MTKTKTPLTVEGTLHFVRAGKGGRREGRVGPKPTPAPGRVPRIARLMALALKFERLIRAGAVSDYAELARLGHVTRARVTQIMNLLHLAPGIQEAILFLPAIDRGRDPLVLRDLQPVAVTLDWRRQRKMWAGLVATEIGGA